MTERAPQREKQRMSNAEADAMLNDYDQDSKLTLTPDEIDEFVERGMSAEWKRYEVRGKFDASHQNNLQARGYFTPVPGSRIPRFGIKDDQPIIIDEMILMERPVEITEARRRKDNAKANAQVSGKLEELGMTKAGHLERTAPKVRRTVENIPD